VETPRTFAWTTAPSESVQGTSTFNEFALQDGGLNLRLCRDRGQVQPGAESLISGSVLFPLKSSGIRSRPVPIIGFEYSH
jgi:hypothetical protein